MAAAAQGSHSEHQEHRIARVAVGVLLAVTLWRVVALYLSDLNLMFDEAQYWTWSLAPAFGYFSKPPMIAWLIAATTGVCGDSEFCIRIASPLVHLATAGVIWLLGARLFGRRVGAAGAVVYATLPAVSFSSGLISTDVPLLFFWALALYAFHRALTGESRTDWALLGLALGAGMLSKYTMVLFVPCAVLFMLLSPAHRRRLVDPGWLIALAIAVAVVLPNLLWNAANGFVTVGHVGDNANLRGALFHPDRLAEFFAAQFAVFGPVLFAVLLYLAAFARRLARDTRLLYLLCFSLPVLALILVQSLLSRAHANWAAVCYVAASVLVAYWLSTRASKVLPALSLGLHLLVMPVIYHFDWFAGVARVSLAETGDPYRRMRGWDRLGGQVARQLAANPGAVLVADERKHLAQLIYYVRPHPLDAVKWNPASAVNDHYDLTTDMRTAAGRPMLLVTRRPTIDHVSPYVRSAVRLGHVEATPYDGLTLAYDLYRLEGYVGAGPEP